MKNLLNGICVVAAFLVHTMAGSMSMAIGCLFRSYCNKLPDAQLPDLSRLVFAYTDTILPVVVGLALGIVSAVVIAKAMRSEKGRDYVPILITVFMVAAILHMVSVWFGSLLPFVITIKGMQH